MKSKKQLIDLRKLFQKRQSVRRFLEKPVDRKLLLQCIEAARLAPSAENVQPWRFLIIDDLTIKSEFQKKAFSGIYRFTKWAEKAPVLVVILAKLDVLANRIGRQITGINYYLIDIGISGEHFVLQAEALGLGTCWIGWFSPGGVRKALKLDRKYRPVAILAVGFPAADKQREKKRKSIDEICWFNELPK